MQVGMTMRDRLPVAEMKFLMSLMDELEREAQMQDAAEAESVAKRFALDLYGRAKGSDKPDIEHPHPSMKWTVVDAPK
eukprot:5300291-Prymnesium_polylepis.1